MPKAPENLRNIESLLEIIAHLRGPNGCPWDKEQTHHSLAPYAIEEVHEFVEALESEKDEKVCDELGDVLFQVILHSQLAHERGAFHFEDVIEAIGKKLIRRHPHVFSDTKVTSSEEVTKNWEAIKRQEKNTDGITTEASYSIKVPKNLPALQRANEIGSIAKKVNFDWPTTDGVLDKINEEIHELKEALETYDQNHIEHEMGDILFSLAQLSRHIGVDPEQALRGCNRRFETRFTKMIEICDEQKKDFPMLPPAEKESLWQKVKKIVG